MVKKAPLTLKDFMASSLIINYPCNRTSSKKPPQMIGKEALLDLCVKMGKKPRIMTNKAKAI